VRDHSAALFVLGRGPAGDQDGIREALGSLFQP
jgi:hypothetical protein